ncbi:MAG: hypothetical protein HY360_08550 [Verrucomicrobia bacterium]|nr:hypothetical protein [Verrucomicrobiota bacterium]
MILVVYVKTGQKVNSKKTVGTDVAVPHRLCQLLFVILLFRQNRMTRQLKKIIGADDAIPRRLCQLLFLILGVLGKTG